MEPQWPRLCGCTRPAVENGNGIEDTMKTLAFAVAGYNLAETGRMIEIARAARKYFDDAAVNCPSNALDSDQRQQKMKSGPNNVHPFSADSRLQGQNGGVEHEQTTRNRPR